MPLPILPVFRRATLNAAVSAVPPTEYVTNPGFETDTAGWADGDITPGSTISRDTGQHRSGAASLKVVTPGGGANEGPMFAVNPFGPGVSFTASAWVKGTIGVDVDIVVIYFDSGPSILNTEASLVTLTGGWDQLTVSGTTRVGTAAVKLYDVTDGAVATTFYVDDVHLVA